MYTKNYLVFFMKRDRKHLYAHLCIHMYIYMYLSLYIYISIHVNYMKLFAHLHRYT